MLNGQGQFSGRAEGVAAGGHQNTAGVPSGTSISDADGWRARRCS